MEEKIFLLRYKSGVQVWSSLTNREELELWKKDGSVEDGDFILICKDYEYYKVKSETKLKLVKV